ncbi:TIGR01777 family oxidoreductase [Spirillospora sp. CA-294931]|uniref:TIGR01777 family oxidoreductase n=1 Tax=Spirillospora sp. CA-294931 TaxID=3240042 RepID=UPI003D8D28A5
MKIVVSGASGLIGGRLVKELLRDGHEVVRLVRREPRGAGEARWSPGGSVDASALRGADAVVHLAGAGVADRPWTASYKRQIRESRLQGTRTLAEAIAGADDGPRVLVCGSAVGFYGDRGGEELDETSRGGTGFLADLVRDWEAAAQPAANAGVRVAYARTGIVLDAKGGLMGKTLLPFKLGLGAKLGNGRQWMSWISLDDEVAALRHLIDHEVAGPVNLTAPAPVTNAEFTKALGRALGRPAVLAVPAFALRAVLRGLADEGPLVSQRAVPNRLSETGFAFMHPELDGALRALLR